MIPWLDGDRAQARHRELPPDDDADGPRVGLLQVHERDERGRDEELVRDRIQQHPDRRHLLVAPREPAVRPVRDRGQEEDGEREVLARGQLRQEEDDEERNEEDPEEREGVRDVEEHRGRILDPAIRPRWTVRLPGPRIGPLMAPPPIVFGTDGWRGQIARDLTFDIRHARRRRRRRLERLARTNTEPGDPWTMPVVHDTRFLSPELAAESAARLASQGFRVLLTDRPVPTPCASWHVKSRGLRAGLAITASHNPRRVERREGQVLVRRKRDAGDVRRGRPLARTARSRRARAAPSRRRDLARRLPRRDRRAASISTRSGAPGLSVLFDAMHGAAGTLLEEIVGAGSRDARHDAPRRRATRSSAASIPSRSRSNLGASRAELSPRAVRRRPRERRRRGPARRSRRARDVRHAPPRPRAPRREPHGSRAHRGRHREDVLDVAPPRPRRGAPRRAAPRHADRLQAHRREDDVRRGRDRRRGVGRPRRLVPPARARRRPLGAPRPRGDRALRRLVRRARSRSRTRTTARSPTAAGTCTSRCRSCARSSTDLRTPRPRSRADSAVTGVDDLDGVKLLFGGARLAPAPPLGNRAHHPHLRRARGRGGREGAPGRDRSRAESSHLTTAGGQSPVTF